MCKSHHPNDLAPGIVVIQNEFLSLLLPCASTGVTACYKPVENCNSLCAGEVVRGWAGRMCGCTLLHPLHPWSRCASAGMQGVGLISVPLCLWATRPNLCLSLSRELCGTRFPWGLIGKMSDMLKVALGFMQSQWCLSQLVDFRVFSKFHWTKTTFGKCLRSSVKFWWTSSWWELWMAHVVLHTSLPFWELTVFPPAFWEKWQNHEKDPVFFVARSEH